MVIGVPYFFEGTSRLQLAVFRASLLCPLSGREAEVGLTVKRSKWYVHVQSLTFDEKLLSGPPGACKVMQGDARYLPCITLSCTSWPVNTSSAGLHLTSTTNSLSVYITQLSSLNHTHLAPWQQIALDRVLFKNTGPAKGNVQLGVTASCEVPTGDLLIGGGDGSLQVRFGGALDLGRYGPRCSGPVVRPGYLYKPELESGLVSGTLHPAVEGADSGRWGFVVWHWGKNLSGAA